jgi:ClpP class serine protease
MPTKASSDSIRTVIGELLIQLKQEHMMGFGDIFWVLFVLFAVWPMLQQRMLDAMRARKIAQLERIRGSRVILLVHRQETMRFLGIPLVRYIDLNDSEAVLRAIHLTDEDVPLDLVLHTPGGLVIAAMQIACAVRDHKSKVTVFVPHYAMSGGTLIALAAQEIVMCDHSVLGPIDPQLGQSPAASLLKVVERKPIERIDDQTLIQADMAGKATAQVQDAAKDLLRRNLPEDRPTFLQRSFRPGRGRTIFRFSPRALRSWDCR